MTRNIAPVSVGGDRLAVAEDRHGIVAAAQFPQPKVVPGGIIRRRTLGSMCLDVTLRLNAQRTIGGSGDATSSKQRRKPSVGRCGSVGQK